jgi:hypothetical protein
MRVQDPKSGIFFNLHGTIFEGKSIGLNQKKRAKRRAHDVQNQDAS